MTEARKLLRSAVALAEPPSEESARVRALTQALLAKTRLAASKYRETRGVLLGGSLAKGTWLPGFVDIDIYVKLDPSVSDERFEEVGLAVGAEATRGHPRGKKFAQHPYTEAVVDGVRVNIVPCFAVARGEWRSAADRSQYHVRLVRRLPSVTKSEIKVLKMFMKAAGVYGAEIEVRGFSGYAAEVLVLQSGGFLKVLRWFSALKLREGERLFSLPDPVDPARDLAIAVSGETLARMILACRDFLRRPDMAFFTGLKRRVHASLRSNLVALTFVHRRSSEDILWGELRRTMKHLVRHLEVSGFKVARVMAASNDSDRSAILLLPEFAELPELEQRVGPTVDRKKDVEAFITSNRRTAKLFWVDDAARVRLVRPRRHMDLKELLGSISKGKAGPLGASPDLERAIKATGKVLEGRSLEKAASTSPWLENGIREILSDAI